MIKSIDDNILIKVRCLYENLIDIESHLYIRPALYNLSHSTEIYKYQN
jgi:hypothetical protein